MQWAQEEIREIPFKHKKQTLQPGLSSTGTRSVEEIVRSPSVKMLKTQLDTVLGNGLELTLL